jgi:coenzyme F420 biosynthesis associated uncharacterized protein
MRHHGLMIDWATAERIAGFVAGAPPSSPALAGQLRELADDSERRVVEYTGLSPAEPLPVPEAVDRRGWIEANLNSMRPVLDPLSERMGEGLGVLAGPMRATTDVVLAAQIGALTGLLAQRVLGQFELTLLDPQGPTRLLFVGPNLDQATRALEADRDELLAWVAFHEVTHGVQFTGVPWLREHMAGLIRTLLESIELQVDAGRLLRLPSTQDLRALVAAVREGELITFIAGRERGEIIDRIQATMAVIEGYAEHVMDAVGEQVLPSVRELRRRLDERRRTRPVLIQVLERLLGLELKLRQYEEGKRFCDSVVAEGGLPALNRVWDSPESMPDLGELRDPSSWVERTAAAAV